MPGRAQGGEREVFESHESGLMIRLIMLDYGIL